MKPMFCSVLGLSLALVSCSTLDPEYAEYKKQKEAQAAGAPLPYGEAADYGIPGDPAAPYQPLPTVENAPPAPEPIPPLPTPGPTPVFPGTTPAPAPSPVAGFPPPAGNTVAHTVVKGDSLWGLARKYGTTVEAIQAANGLSGANIQAGRTLQIPSNN